MDRAAFTETLGRALYGKLDDASVAEHIRYYEEYISQEEAKGRSEQEILDELGDPRLLARTILETSAHKGFHEEGEQGALRTEIRIHRFEGWKAALFMALAAAAVILLAIVVFRVLAMILPLLIAVGLAVWLIRRFDR